MQRASSKPQTTAAVIREVEQTGKARRLPGRRVAVVPLSELRRLRQLARLAEAAVDNAAADDALAESGERIPYDQVRRELGLDRA
jgi:rRNA-processing protein FCF1